MSRARTFAKKQGPGRKPPSPKILPRTGPFLTGKKLNAVLCVLLAAATIALYSPVLGHSFVLWDDRDYVTANRHVHGGLSWSTIKWAITSTAEANWHPLTWISHALDYQFFALNPAGHHLDSILIHALNAVLLFLLLAWVTRRRGPSLLVAALFAFHPFNVESVAWVAERKNVLSTLFWLLAIGAYAWYARRPGWRRYLLVAALFAAGLAAKPMVISLPFVLLLLDYWPLERTVAGHQSPVAGSQAPQMPYSRLILEKIPLLLLSAASALVTLKAQRPAMRTSGEFPLVYRIGNAIVSYGSYLGKMAWPEGMVALYRHPGNALPRWQVVISALVLLGVTTLVVVFRRRRYLPVGWFWFLGTLVPVIGLVQVGIAAMADRYAYVPLTGIFVMIAYGLDDWADAKKIPMAWRVVPAVCVLAALGVVTLRQMSYWNSEYTLWAHAVAVGDRNPHAHGLLASALMDPDSAMSPRDLQDFDTEQKRMEEARRHRERALDLYRQSAQQNPETYLPYVATALNDLGNVEVRQGRTDEARRHL
jgi:protein O-mannosyl-transferase